MRKWLWGRHQKNGCHRAVREDSCNFCTFAQFTYMAEWPNLECVYASVIFSICPFRGLAKLRVLGFSSWQLSRGQNEHATEVRFSGPEPLRTSMGENPLLSTRNVCLQTPAGTSCCLSVLLPSGHARSTCHFASGSCSLRIPVVS